MVHEARPDGTEWTDPDRVERETEAATGGGDGQDVQPRDIYLHHVVGKQWNRGADGTDEPGNAGGGERRTQKAPPSTGEPRVDAALSLLNDLAELPVHEHPGLFEQVHRQLSEVLGELDSGPGDADQAGR